MGESRSIAYSADSAGRAGRIACQVIRSDSLDDARVRYAIAIRNDTGSDAQASASIPDALHLRHRTIVQSVIAAHSQFSTAVQLDVEKAGEIPELHVQLTGEDIEFALIVPNAHAAVGPEAGAPRLAIAAQPRANGASLPAAPADAHRTVLLRAVPRPPPRHDYWPPPRPPDASGRAGEPIAVVTAQKSPSALPMVAIFAVILMAVGVAVFRPQLRDLDVPPQAQAGSTMLVRYRASGFGSAGYRVVGADGERIASGSLATGAGAFAVALPKDRTDGAYLVSVGISGILGSASAEEYVKVKPLPLSVPIAAAAPRAPAPPQIRSLALDRATLGGGETLNVYYDVAAASGTVALLDAGSQIAYGTSPLSPSGHTAFVIPNMPSERFLTVVLSASRGSASTQSRVAVTVEPQPSPSPLAAASDLAPQAAGAPVTDLPVIDTPKTVRSGQAFAVQVHSAVPGLVLVLSDDAGKELARREIALASPLTSTTFIAPAVPARTRIRLEGTYPEGAGSETIVKTIDIIPR